jgi:hypothetical protein
MWSGGKRQQRSDSALTIGARQHLHEVTRSGAHMTGHAHMTHHTIGQPLTNPLLMGRSSCLAVNHCPAEVNGLSCPQ